MSIVAWAVIFIFSKQIAELVGCPGYESVIIFAAFCIPVEALSSIQMALYKRSFDFRTLFFVRIISVLVPIFVSVPLAYFTRSHWALIIGMLVLNLANAFLLTIKSPWKPKLFFDVKLLKEMFGFSMWTLIESISIWLTSYVDIFIVGSMLSQYFLGIYRTSMTTVGQITSVVVSATTPVLYSALSRLQNDRNEFFNIFFKFQKTVGLLIIPLGIGMFLFRSFIVEILLGPQWTDAAYFIGLWGFSTAFTVILAHYCSEVYRSLGRPKLSVVVQFLHFIALVPVLLIYVEKDFSQLCLARTIVRFQLIGVNLCMVKIVINMPIMRMFVNVLPSVLSACIMTVAVLLIKKFFTDNNVVLISVAIIVYFSIIYLIPSERNVLLSFVKRFKR